MQCYVIAFAMQVVEAFQAHWCMHRMIIIIVIIGNYNSTRFIKESNRPEREREREREKEANKEATKIVTEKMTYNFFYTVHIGVN